MIFLAAYIYIGCFTNVHTHARNRIIHGTIEAPLLTDAGQAVPLDELPSEIGIYLANSRCCAVTSRLLATVLVVIDRARGRGFLFFLKQVPRHAPRERGLTFADK